MMNRNSTVYHGEEIVETTQIDVTWEQVRAERDRELSQTDWRAVKDRTMSQAWKDYRTSLRDLPQDFTEANDAADNWPVVPDE
tara:strand:+ start:495 stop:743 length:249 start_codon:yes stop_codon:yes gene_type:complete